MNTTEIDTKTRIHSNSSKVIKEFLLALCATVLAGSARGAPLFVSNGSGTVGEYTTSGATVNASLITGVNVFGLATDGTNLYVANLGNTSLANGTIGVYTTSGTTVNASLISGLNGPISLALYGNELFVGNESNGTIGEYTTSGVTVNASLITGLNEPWGLATDGIHLFVATDDGTIREYTTSGVMINASLVGGLNGPHGLVVIGNHLFVATQGDSTIGEYTTSGVTVNASLITGLNAPFGLATDGTNLYVANQTNGTIGVYTTSGATVNASLISGLNEPFAVAVPQPVQCIYSLSGNSAFFGAQGGTNTISVEAGSPCPWTATASNSWISIFSGSSGVGTGTVSYTIDVNASSNARTGTITVADQTFTVTQMANMPPQVSITPVSPIILPVNTVNLVATVTDDGAPSGTLNSAWSTVSGPGPVVFGNVSNANTTATFSTNGTYVLQLTASDGVLSASNDVTVIVDIFPVITSPPTVTNVLAQIGGVNIVLAGATNYFAAGASDPNGNPLGCLWDFGDAQTSSDCEPSHVFSNCGPHEVTVVVSDGIASVTTSLIVSVMCPFSQLPKPASLKMKSNFLPGKLDTAALKAFVDIPPGFSVTNTAMSVEVAGAVVPFTMNAKGRAVNAFSTIKLSHKGRGTSMVWQVSANLKGDWDAVWQNYGLTNATVTAMPESFYIDKSLLYKATVGKSGTGQ
jgi:hypothetical protein